MKTEELSVKGKESRRRDVMEVFVVCILEEGFPLFEYICIDFIRLIFCCLRKLSKFQGNVWNREKNECSRERTLGCRETLSLREIERNDNEG